MRRSPSSSQLRKASRDDSRRWNLLTALQAIARHGTVSRADIARVTGLTRATVSSLVAELIAEGLVHEVGVGEAESAGKPPTLLAINGDGRDIVALDLSRQPFQAAMFDLAGEITHREVADAPATGDEAVETAIRLAETCLAASSNPILGLGVGTPGIIDPEGTITEAANLDWHDLPLRRILAERLGLAVSVANDAHVAALAELRATDGADTLLLVTVAEGIGAGLVLDGALHSGQHLSSGEIGHVVDRARRRPVPLWARRMPGDGGGRAGRRPPGRRLPRPCLGGERGPAAGGGPGHVISAIDVDRVVINSDLARVDGYVDAVADELTARIHRSRRPHLSVSASEVADPVLAGAAAIVMRDELGVILR